MACLDSLQATLPPMATDNDVISGLLYVILQSMATDNDAISGLLYVILQPVAIYKYVISILFLHSVLIVYSESVFDSCIIIRKMLMSLY